MDLESVLRSIHSLSDLPRLVTQLGHPSLWEPVPDEVWSRPGGSALRVTAVGHTGNLPWFAIESQAPERDALVLARRISRRGRIGIVLALDIHRRHLGVAAASDRCPGLAVDLADPDPETAGALGRLAAGPDEGGLAFAVRAAEALSAEPVGRRFFRVFRLTLERMAAGLPGPMPAEDRHALVLLHLTRVLFLYFIQAKGWLAGRERFLAEKIDGCLSRGRRIHRDLLRPLFFGTLNQPTTTRSRGALGFGPIPFLNGGLFEPHPLERRYRFGISNELWRTAFDDLFERFHFTVTEGAHGGSVAPDMLGRVFEGVMEPGDRRASGTFYTPAALVAQVLDAALVVLLSSRLGCTESEAERRLREPDHRARQVLGSLTLLDPAVGSGAFLLCALERLSAVGTPAQDHTARRRRVLQSNLFGVDRNAAAVRLTELRLWLAVIADDPAGHPENVTPLPNLDCLIRQGDSLIEPLRLELRSPSQKTGRELAAELSYLRREVIGATGTAKRSLVRRLRAVELRALKASLEATERLHLSAVAECLEQARSADLFGQRRGLDRELQRRLATLRLAVKELRQARRRLAGEGEVPWFHYQSHFADVFSRGGFDLVIGNPPWLRSEAVRPALRRQLVGRYRWWRTTGPSYRNGPDLAVAFLERALELAAPSGVVAMLVPAKIATAGYGAAARHALAHSSTLHVLADLTRTSPAPFDATVYPLALIAGKTAAPPGQQVRTALAPAEGCLIPQAELGAGGPWILAGSELRSVLGRIERVHPALGQSVTGHLGVKTGLNRVFLDPPSDVEPEVLRWAMRGRDLRAFRWRSRLRLLWSHDNTGRPCTQLPPRARAYLKPFEAELRARRDYRGGPPWTLFRARPAVARYRVVWSDLARRLTAVALTRRNELQYVPLNTCYVAPMRTATRAHALAAWLNSTSIAAIARLGAMPAAGGFARFNAGVVARLPLPDSALGDPVLARLGRSGRAGAAVQEEVDALAAQHLGLSTAEQGALRAVVDDASAHRR